MPCENDGSLHGQGDQIGLLNGRVRLFQPRHGLRTAIDSVFLAAAAPVRPEESVLDLGCGVGAAGFCIAERVRDVHLYGVDCVPELVDLARDNAKINIKTATCEFLCSDILSPDFSLSCGRVDHVVCNPPYLKAKEHVRSPDILRALASGYDDPDRETLEKWLRVAHRCLKSHGTLTLVHRADYLDMIFKGLGPRFGAVEIIPLWPRAGQAAKRVIVRAIKDRRGPPTIHAGVVLHDDFGWTSVARSILEEAMGLFIQE